MGKVASTLRGEQEIIPDVRGGLAVRLAGAALGLCALLVLAGIALDLLVPPYLGPNPRVGPILVLLFGLLALVSCTSGVVLAASSRSGNAVGAIFCALGLLYALGYAATTYADYALVVEPSLPFGAYAVWLSTSLGTWGVIACGILLALLFPVGRLPSRRWRPVVWTVVLGVVLLACGEAFRPGPLQYYVGNPLGVGGSVGGIPAHRISELSSVLGGAALLAGAGLSLRAVVSGTRARAEGRRPLMWTTTAAAAMVGSAGILLDLTVERLASLLADRVVWPGLMFTGALARAVGVEVESGRVAELRSDVLLSSAGTLAILCLPLSALGTLYDPRSRYAGRVLRSGAGALWAPLRRLGWSRVLVASSLAGLLPFAFVYLGIYVFVLVHTATGSGPPDEQLLGGVAAFVTGWGARSFFLTATVVLAWWAARGAWEGATWHGILVGFLGAIINQAVVRGFLPPVTLAELSVYVTFGVVGGGLGGALGRASLSGEVYRASRQVGGAKDADTVAAAFGEHLGGPDVRGVSLWRYVRREASSGDGGEPARDLALWGTWGTGDRHLARELRKGVVSVLGRLNREVSVTVRSSELPASQRAFWERAGIRSALLIALVAPSESWRGVAVVTFGNNRRRFSRNRLRAYLTVSAQAALVLENLRLLEEARVTGRQTGILVERQRMAHEIHDTLAQGFASVIVSLSAAEMSRGARGAPGDWSRHLQEARRTAREGLTEARRLVWALRPGVLDRRSLPEALEVLAREWTADTGIEAQVTTSGAARSLRPEAEVALLRVAQESLTNVRKHARARGVTITLSHIGDRVALDVHDDGVGFDAPSPERSLGAGDTGGFGLRGMRERIERLGGTLQLESIPGEGSTIVAELPLAGEGSGDLGPPREVHDA